MQLVIFCIAYPILWLISKLPFPVLYLVSDVVYVILYRIVGYRKKVVYSNLQIAFPQKTHQELKLIEKEFYHYLCDMFLEMIKTLTISEQQISKRFKFTNVEVIQKAEQEKSIMLMFPHYASYEWIIILDKYIASKGYAVYQKIDNRYFNNLVVKIRQRFGLSLVDTKNTIREVTKNKVNGVKAIYGILSDQSPSVSQTHYWRPFFNVTVPMHTGAEVLAKRLDLSVMYLEVKRVKRGYYEASFEMIAEDPKKYKDYRITDMFIEKVEQQINEAPPYYLWTHKRWKHRNKVPKEWQ
ncbi:lysophospholipid acyltransferase family protein [Zhouia sp. PK063]|uniref:lysophospholipid acyltransferase family protein n=1 Tax=Zhouia sp. PK063 TaxID=3373602 RepID=UPI00378AEFED